MALPPGPDGTTEAEQDLSDAKKQELLAIFEKEKPKEKAKAAEEEPSSEHERA